MKNEVLQGLEICFKTANLLKSEFPNEIMKINNDTILAHESKNKKIRIKSMSNDYAKFTNKKPHRIIIKQKALIEQKIFRTKI